MRSNCVRIGFILLGTLLRLAAGQLSQNYYASSCPNAESIVSQSIAASIRASNVVPIAMLRLFAHDCFVEGCDASILISSSQGNSAERDFPDNANFPQNPFDAIIQAKTAVEAACPGKVSCADILAIAARDGVAMSGGPTWQVLKGRKDGRVSQASRVSGHLPGNSFNVQQLGSMFGNLGLNLQDMVALSGAHTIGFAHCKEFSGRLYNFNATFKADPSINPNFLQTLKNQCPQFGASDSTIQSFDITSPFLFDNAYFRNLQQGNGLLFSDQVLFNDAKTRNLVNTYASDQNAFFQAFAQAMIKMGSIGIKTAANGEVRRDCTRFN